MKVALVHDWLNQKVGGAENVLFELADLYPDADIYTLIYNKALFGPHLAGRNIITSKLQNRPSSIKKRPALLLGGIRKAIENWDFNGYDVVISSSTAWVKNISIPKGTKHICYCHSPARMMWDSWPGYLNTVRLGGHKLGLSSRLKIARQISALRLWDYYSSSNVDVFIANSHYVSGRIQKYYHRKSRVVYPPVETGILRPKGRVVKQDFYLILSVLAQYKQIEVAIASFKRSGKRLIIAGDGPDKERLQKLSQGNANITFLGRVNDEHKRELLQTARGFVFCGIEDFGITIAESVAAQTAVIAAKGGGAEEILVPQKTGWFYDVSQPKSIDVAVDEYEKDLKNQKPVDFEYVYKKFSTSQFDKDIKNVVNNAIS